MERSEEKEPILHEMDGFSFSTRMSGYPLAEKLDYVRPIIARLAFHPLSVCVSVTGRGGVI